MWEESPLFLTRAEFEKTLEGWTLDPLLNEAGEVAMVFVVNGPAFHFAKFDKAYQPGRKDLRRYPGEMIERYGYALTSTPREDARQLKFNRRLGFYQVGEDEYDIHQRIDKLRYNSKETSCPSSR